MTDTRELFLDKELQAGGYYELSIQVCLSKNKEPLKLYTDFIWALSNVEGPFDGNFNKIQVDIQNNRHEGLLHLEDYTIPFITFSNITEDEPVETDFGWFTWFDIGFYTAAIEKIFGSEYLTWTENPKSPKQLDDFFMSTMKQLYKLYPFQIALFDFEISGDFDLDSLKKDLDLTRLRFFVGRENYNFIAEKNKKFVTIIE